jgi:hypothetical protein
MGMMSYWDMDTRYHKHYSDFLDISHKYVDTKNQEVSYQQKLV